MKKICVICNKEFEAYSVSRGYSRGARWVGKRPARSITCSKICSKIHSHNLNKNRKKKKTKKCKYCNKIIKGGRGNRRFCNPSCRYQNQVEMKRKDYHKNKEKYIKYDLCRCGNKKYVGSKQCNKCYRSNKLKYRLSRLK